MSAAPAVGWKYAPPSAIHHHSRRVLQYPSGWNDRASTRSANPTVSEHSELVSQQGRPTAAQLSSALAQLSSGCDAILRCGGRVRPAYVQWLALLFGLPRLHRPLELARACAAEAPTVSDSARTRVLARVHECRYACVCACMHACVRQLASAQATMHHASQAAACRVGPCRVMSAACFTL